MKTVETPLSIRIIYWAVNIIFGLILLIGIVTLVFNGLLYTSFFGDDLQLHAQMPVKVNILVEGSLFLNQSVVKVELVEATSMVHFFNTPLFIARKFGSAFLIAYAFLFYIFFMFRKFIVNVKKNKIFEASNIELLWNIAYGLLAFWLFAIIYSRLAYQYIGKAMEFQHVEILQDYPNYPGLLALALFLWVLSHVFLVGVKLKEEQDLTI